MHGALHAHHACPLVFVLRQAFLLLFFVGSRRKQNEPFPKQTLRLPEDQRYYAYCTARIRVVADKRPVVVTMLRVACYGIHKYVLYSVQSVNIIVCVYVDYGYTYLPVTVCILCSRQKNERVDAETTISWPWRMRIHIVHIIPAKGRDFHLLLFGRRFW